MKNSTDLTYLNDVKGWEFIVLEYKTMGSSISLFSAGIVALLGIVCSKTRILEEPL